MKDFELYLKSYLSHMRFRFIVLILFIASSVFSQKKKEEFTLVNDTISLYQFHYDRSYFHPAIEPIVIIKTIHHYKGFPFKKSPTQFVYFNPGEKLISRKEDLEPAPAYPDFSKKYNQRVHQKYLYESKKHYKNRWDAYFYFSNALRYYLDSADVFVPYEKEYLKYDSISISDFSNFFQPFYFSKNEVSNSEYHEFLDSMASNKNIPLYPDTLSWTRNFPYDAQCPMERMYFWHPVYKNYPVVGINYWQAKVFCEWKTKQLQKEFEKINPNISVSVDLPSMVEWEYVMEQSYDYNDGKNKENLYTSDQGFVTDLMLTHKDVFLKQKSFYTRVHPLREFLYQNTYTFGNMQMDGSLHARYPLVKEKIPSAWSMEIMNSKDIQFMGNNVSEWTNHDYSQWSGIFAKRQQHLLNSKSEEDSIISKIEKYYDKWNDKNGKLVIGGNWSDERHSLQLGQNLQGAYSKRFVNPDSAYCTVGFRYVVHVKLKNDTTEHKTSVAYQRPPNSFNFLLENCDDWVLIAEESVLVSYTGREEIILKRKTDPSSIAFCAYIKDWDDIKNTIKLKVQTSQALYDANDNSVHFLDLMNLLDTYRVSNIDENTVKLTLVKDK